MSSRRIALAFAALALAGCSTATRTATVGPLTAETRTATAGVSGPLGTVDAGLVVGSITAPPPPAPEDPAIAGLMGPWTLARDGDRVCAVTLGARNPSGDLSARTERCTSVELARTAFWTTDADGLVLYDFDRRPIVALAPIAGGAYEGTLPGGTRLTFWR